MYQTKPQLHFRLDKLSANTGQSGQFQQGSVHQKGAGALLKTPDSNQPTQKMDPAVGSYLEFDGVDDYLEVVQGEELNFSNGFSVAIWLKVEPLTNKDMKRALTLRTTVGERLPTNLISILFTKDKLQVIAFGKLLKFDNFPFNEWVHVAFIGQPKWRLELYLNGVFQSIPPNNSKLECPKRPFVFVDSYLGAFFKNKHKEQLFKGGMANFRLYERPLANWEIESLVRLDRGQIASTRAVNPLQVSLNTDDDDQYLPALFIEDDQEGYPLELRLENPTDKAIQLKNLTDQNPTADNFHIQLRFRKQVVAPNFWTQLQQASDKKIGDWRYAVNSAEREDWLSLIYDGDGEVPIEPGTGITLRLPGFRADAAGGARNTRVEVRTQLARFDTPVSVIRHLEILSRVGQKNVPLIAQIIGSNTFLNDGNAGNSLTIKISYTKAQGELKLTAGTSAENASCFSLRLPAELVSAVSLPKATKDKDDKISDSERFQVETVPTGDQQDKVFQIFAKKEGATITADTPLYLQLDGWTTNTPNGTYYFSLSYEDLPGYWDGSWNLPVQMSPLVIREGNVGIGTTPAHKLHVSGETLLLGNINVGKEGEEHELGVYGNSFITGKLGVGVEEIEHDLHVKGSTLLLGNINVGKESEEHELKVYGKLGIGTEPTKTLHVKGDSLLEGDLCVGGSGESTIKVRRIDGKNFNSNAADGLYLNYDNSKDVHVGSSNANAQLIVNGNALITSSITTNAAPQWGSGVGNAKPWFKTGKITGKDLEDSKETTYDHSISELSKDYILVAAEDFVSSGVGMALLRTPLYRDGGLSARIFHYSFEQGCWIVKIGKSDYNGLKNAENFSIHWFAIHRDLFVDTSASGGQ